MKKELQINYLSRKISWKKNVKNNKLEESVNYLKYIK